VKIKVGVRLPTGEKQLHFIDEVDSLAEARFETLKALGDERCVVLALVPKE
jgi:hypothetical protein